MGGDTLLGDVDTAVLTMLTYANNMVMNPVTTSYTRILLCDWLVVIRHVIVTYTVGLPVQPMRLVIKHLY